MKHETKEQTIDIVTILIFLAFIPWENALVAALLVLIIVLYEVKTHRLKHEMEGVKKTCCCETARPESNNGHQEKTQRK